jgi:beta-phosphoglucomutase-like phosphatase (HAD superfamily)
MKEECFGFSEDIFSSKILNYLSSRAMLNTSISSVSDREFFARFAGDRSDRWKTFCSLGMVKPLPGAVAFVMQAYERFGPLALNTGSPEALSKPMLELALGKELDVNKIFPFSLRTHSSDLPQGLGKPNPDGYTRAAALLRIPPWELMAVVDRGNDCISALRAGYGRVVIVPENGDTAPLYSPGGKHSLTSFLSIMPESDRLEVQKRVVVIDTLEGFSLD